MPSKWDTVEVRMTVLRVNLGRSVLIRTLDGLRQLWLPAKWVIYYPDDQSMQMPRWLAEEEGFELYERDYGGAWSQMPHVRGGSGGSVPRGDLASDGGEVARPQDQEEGH